MERALPESGIALSLYLCYACLDMYRKCAERRKVMLHLLLPDTYDSLLAFAGILFAFAATVFATAKLQG